MIRHRITLSYEGSCYHGFQSQKNALAIQDVLEERLEKLYGRTVKVEAAGRTDAGVHARGQVVAFTAPPLIPTARLPAALNGLLPEDIVVLGAGQEKESFCPRRDARAKIYSYTVDNGPFPDVFWRRFAWHLPCSLDLEAMRAGAHYLAGRHDFKAFQASGSAVENTVRTIYALDIERRGSFIKFLFRGDGFLYKMVRNITGTLVEVGQLKKEPGDIENILFAGDRRLAGETAPAKGLCLEKVFY